jgi:TatA/E family protein of Tat protein translocase
MAGLGLPELLLIGALLVFLFGAKRIPELFSGLGSGIRNFKKAMNDEPAPAAVAIEAKSKEDVK